MSRLAGLLLVVLATTASADTTEPSSSTPKSEAATPKANKFPLRVVKVMADSEQALLFDKNRGRHVLVEVGETVGDYTVSGIDEDEVTLTGKDLPVEVVLAAPEKRKHTKPKHEPIAAPTDEAPADPYADVAVAPADPYDDAPDVDATQPPPRHASAKGEGEKSTTSPFAGMSADAAKPSDEVANAGKPAATKPAPAAPEAKVSAHDAKPAVAKPDAKPAVADDDIVEAKPVVDGPTRLSKKEVSAALTDFAKLAASIDGSFTSHGLALEKVATGSVFAKAGLVAGDVITSVDGKPLKTIDDAADLYARAGGMKSATVQIVRAGKPATLRIAIQ